MMDSELTNRQIAERLGMPLREYRRVQFADGTFSSYEQDIPEYGFRNWTGSTDAALTLPLPEGLYFVLMGNGGDWTCSISPRLGVVECDVESAATPAEAVCAVWWAWMEAK